MNTSLGGSNNCSAIQNGFDPDIAGIGAVVAFYTTALIAIFSVLAAYLMGSLPRVKYKDVEFLLIDAIRRLSPWRRHSRLDIKTALQKGRRFETCFEKLLEPLADQQLVTSLAILIAACSKWGQITLFSLGMAWMMATISLVTHMTAIRYCPEYLRDNPLLGFVRAAAVFIIMVGFISLLIVLEYAQFQANILAVGIDGYSAGSVAQKMQVACLISQPISTPPDLGLDIFWSIVALTYYVNILTKLYSGNGEIHASSFVYRFFLYCLHRKPANFGSYQLAYKSRQEWIFSTIPRPLQNFCYYLADMEAAYLAIKTSVSADIPWLFFVLVYCLAQLKTVWLNDDSPFWDPETDSGSLGFGQLTALILLAVPILAGLDSFLGAWPKNSKEAAPSPAEDEEHGDVEAGDLGSNAYSLTSIVNASDLSIRGDHGDQIELAPSTDNLENLDGESFPDQLPLTETADKNNTTISIQPDDRDSILDRRGFQNFLYILSIWNMAVIIYAGIITGGPWEGENVNMSATVPIASLFGWEVLLELWNVSHVVFHIVIGKMTGKFRRNEEQNYDAIREGTHEDTSHSGPPFIDTNIPNFHLQ